MADRAEYFLSHRIPGELPEACGPFEIQVLDEHSQAVAVGHVREPATDVVIDGHAIPLNVVAAAISLPIGFGEYANAEGAWVDPWGRPVRPLPSDREQLADRLLKTAERLIDTRVPGGEPRLRALVDHYGETAAAETARAILRARSRDSA